MIESNLNKLVFQQQITEQVAEVKTRSERLQAEAQERHRQQVLDLTARHSTELERQRAALRQEFGAREEALRRQMAEMETSMTEYRNENAELKRSKQKLEAAR